VFQIVVGCWYQGLLVTGKEAGSKASRNFEKVVNGYTQSSNMVPLRVHHCQQMGEALAHQGWWFPVFIGQQMGHLMHPLIGELNAGPQVSASREGFGQDAAQVR
jgi:hypothetical protein